MVTNPGKTKYVEEQAFAYLAKRARGNFIPTSDGHAYGPTGDDAGVEKSFALFCLLVTASDTWGTVRNEVVGVATPVAALEEIIMSRKRMANSLRHSQAPRIRQSFCVNPVCRKRLPYHANGVWSIFCRSCLNHIAARRVRCGEIECAEDLETLEENCMPVWYLL